MSDLRVPPTLAGAGIGRVTHPVRGSASRIGGGLCGPTSPSLVGPVAQKMIPASPLRADVAPKSGRRRMTCWRCLPCGLGRAPGPWS
eukprot:scaffold2054_cov175-Prasinococcus_capsulatus_cf.AAC.1